MTVGEMIEKLQKLPPDAEVRAMTAFGLRKAGVFIVRTGGEVHILGELKRKVR